METKKDLAVADPQSPTPQQQVLLELIYSIKGLASNLESMHKDLKQVLEDESRARDKELDKIKEVVLRNQQSLQVMPVLTADRLDRLIDKKVDGVLEDVRLSLNEVREKLWHYMKAKEALSAVPSATQNDDITGSFLIQKNEVKLHFKTETLEKFWKVAKWIAVALGSVGGGWTIIKNFMK